MDSYQLPDAIEPDYWNVVFHPSQGRTARILLGRFQHVSAFTYVPGFRAWLCYDVQWSGMRLAMFSMPAALTVFVHYTKNCAIIKFDRNYGQLGLMSRLGFYCVPAIKQLLGLSCVAVTPDGLYRHLIKHGGSLIHGSVSTTTTAAGSAAARGEAAGASHAG
jgi:hypothetical protein